MPSIKDICIVDSNTAKAKKVEHGLERTLCSAELCDSKNLTVYKRTIERGKQLELEAANDYQLVYVMNTPAKATVSFKGQENAAEEGAGVLLTPGESARFEASGGDLELLHMVVPKPPAGVEDGLPGGPGYFFNRKTLRGLSDASGGRVRRFCAESSVRLPDGSRLTATNAIQAGEMHYNEGGSSPRQGRSRRDLARDRARHARVLSAGYPAPAARARRHARLLRDPSLAKLQDDDLERGAARLEVVLRAREAGCGARGVEPELTPARLSLPR
jgi:hypothetical protein